MSSTVLIRAAALALGVALAATAPAQDATKRSGDAVKQSSSAHAQPEYATKRTGATPSHPPAPRQAASVSKTSGVAAASGAAPLARACAASDALACFKLGASFAGDGPVRDPAKAFAAFARACDLSIGEACFIAAWTRADGAPGIPADKAEAAILFRKGCEGGVARACQMAGNLTTGGEGPLALAFYDRACLLRDGRSCHYIAQLWASGDRLTGGRADGGRALAYAGRGCDAANGEACGLASYLALGNLGAPRDDRAALRYATAGCAIDFYGGCKQLGYITFGNHDYTAARQWYARACKLSNEAESCKTVGTIDAYLSDLANRSAEQRRWDAQQASGAATVSRYLSAGRYGDAMDTAVVDLGSSGQASRVLEAAADSGRLADIADIHLDSLDGRWPDLTARAKAIVKSELRRRSDVARAQARTRMTASSGSSYSWAPASSGSSSSSSSYSASAAASTYVSESSVYREARDRAATSYCNAGWGCR